MPDLKVVTPAPSTRLEALVEDYLAHCRAKGLSPKTIRDNYGYALKGVFLPWAAQEGISEPAQITSRVLDRFSAHLLEHGGKRGPLSRFSIASFVESVNWWLRWLRAEGEVDTAAKAQVPRRPQRVLDVLSREEIQAKGQDWAPAYTSNSIGLDVMSNGDGTVSQGHLIGKQYIGEEWQCVELAQRWALVFSKESPAKWPVRAAFEMWGAGPSLPIKWLQHPNGGADSPEPGDLLVFKQSVHSTQQFGHVAVVTNVSGGYASGSS